MRSSSSMNCVRQLSSVVLPEPVPPEIERVDAAAADHLEDLGAFRRDRAELDQLVERQLVLLELADGERRPVDRQRRHDDVDARAVGQARVADRRGFVDAAADLADDALADVQELLVVAEADAGLLDLAVDFDVGRAGAVHHDVGDVVAREQRLERAIAEHVVADVLEQLFLVGDRHHHVLDGDDLVDDVADFLARRHRVELGELGEVDRLDQRAENLALGLVETLGAAALGHARGPRIRYERRRLGGEVGDSGGGLERGDRRGGGHRGRTGRHIARGGGRRRRLLLRDRAGPTLAEHRCHGCFSPGARAAWRSAATGNRRASAA